MISRKIRKPCELHRMFLTIGMFSPNKMFDLSKLVCLSSLHFASDQAIEKYF